MRMMTFAKGAGLAMTSIAAVDGSALAADWVRLGPNPYCGGTWTQTLWYKVSADRKQVWASDFTCDLSRVELKAKTASGVTFSTRDINEPTLTTSTSTFVELQARACAEIRPSPGRCTQWYSVSIK